MHGRAREAATRGNGSGRIFEEQNESKSRRKAGEHGYARNDARVREASRKGRACSGEQQQTAAAQSNGSTMGMGSGGEARAGGLRTRMTKRRKRKKAVQAVKNKTARCTAVSRHLRVVK